MALYLAQRIYKGKLYYTMVIAKYPQFKTEIDAYLAEWGWDG